MINYIKGKGIIVAVSYLFLSLSFGSCTRPGDDPLNKQDDSVPMPATPEVRKPALYTVNIDMMKFQPAVINVHQGDTIVWINKDLVDHCVTEESHNAWASSKIPHDGSWRMIATESCDYYCAIHKVMKGQIVVE